MVTNSGDLVGRVLGGCKLESLIGQGGMSAVYLARQMQPERYVAVKVLMPRFDISSEDYRTFLARFRREANIVAKLEHINIVPLYAYGEERQLAYLVMPYIGGGSLGDVIEERGKLSLQQTFHYLQQAATALDYAHARNVVHRDLKPSNFLLYPGDNRLVLADFGVARITDEDPLGGYEAALTQTGVTPGTLAYMAPEMLQDARAVDYRVDIYALGIVLYQLLSGRLPFTGDLLALINKQLEEALPPLHQRDPAIPTSIDSVLRKATAKRRQERYSSASQLAEEFRIAMSDGPVVRSGGSNIETGGVINDVVSRGDGGGNRAGGIREDRDRAVGEVEEDVRGMEAGGKVSGNINAAVDKVDGDVDRVKTSSKARRLIDGVSPKNLYTNAAANTQIVGTKTLTPPPLRRADQEDIATKDTDVQATAARNSRKWSRKVWLSLVAIPLLLGLLTGGAWMFYHANASSTDTAQAQHVIQQFYTDLNSHDYNAAYALFAPELQNRISYVMFTRTYANAVHFDITIEYVNEPVADNVDIVVTLHVLRIMPRGEVTNIVRFGDRLIRRDGVWKIAATKRQLQA